MNLIDKNSDWVLNYGVHQEVAGMDQEENMLYLAALSGLYAGLNINGKLSDLTFGSITDAASWMRAVEINELTLDTMQRTGESLEPNDICALNAMDRTDSGYSYFNVLMSLVPRSGRSGEYEYKLRFTQRFSGAELMSSVKIVQTISITEAFAQINSLVQEAAKTMFTGEPV